MNTDERVYALLSTVSSRVFPDVFPIGVDLPVVTYQRISDRRAISHDGTALVGVLYQISVWDRVASTARAVAREILGQLELEIGTWRVENTYGGFDPERKDHRAAIDARVWVPLDEEVDVGS